VAVVDHTRPSKTRPNDGGVARPAWRAAVGSCELWEEQIEFCRHLGREIGYKGLLSEVLARVKSRAVEGPRGPDVVHRVKVRREWLTVGEVVELELPRNLACAACCGGGCDTCGRSGAITLRRRSEPAEMVEVTLPARSDDELPDSRGITLRIPEQGGLPPPNSDLPRGVLLLTVVPSHDPDPSIKLLRGVPSKRPPASIVDTPEMPAAIVAPAVAPRGSRARTLFIVALVLWVLALIWLRMSGRG
jgi:hypothetical protein